MYQWKTAKGDGQKKRNQFDKDAAEEAESQELDTESEGMSKKDKGAKSKVHLLK